MLLLTVQYRGKYRQYSMNTEFPKDYGGLERAIEPSEDHAGVRPACRALGNIVARRHATAFSAFIVFLAEFETSHTAVLC